jgi:peptidoglycan/LPS O-acetylase OafA/YrhL
MTGDLTVETAARLDVARPAAGPAAPPSAATPRLRHEPALDGLRGLAVVAVVIFHLGHLTGGFLGVDLFFVLSGFLITSLLIVEHRERGAIDLRAFWVRRARRLLPAVLVMLAGVAVLLATLTPTADRPRFRGEALATLGYVANWQRMTADVSYWDIFSQPSPLDHTWSLAIEEQFYVLWPLVVLAVLAVGVGRRTMRARAGADASTTGPAVTLSPRVRLLGIGAAAAGVGSLALLAATYSPVDTNRAYFATDTRLGPTLLGAALAAFVAGRPRREHPPSAGVELSGVVALVVIGWSLLVVDGQGAWYYRGGLALFALASLVVILSVTGGPPGRLSSLVSARPLAALGAISYGVYLWHWPVIVYLTADRAHVDGVALDVLQVAVTLAAALVSYRLVEQPVRRGALRGRTAALATVAAMAVVAGAAVVVTRGPQTATADVAEIAPTDARPYSIFPAPADIPSDATRLLLVGDSGPIFLGPELVAEAEQGDEVVVAMSSQLGCSPSLVGGRTRYPDGRVVEKPVCPEQRREAWEQAVDRFDPDVVVYYLANAGGLGEGIVDGDWVTDCDAAFDDFLEQELIDDVEVLGADGATVAFATSPYVAMFTVESDQRVDCRNETYGRVVEQTPGTQILDMNAFMTAETATADQGLLRDFVHLNHEGASRVATWMVPQIPGLAPAG